MLTMKNFKAQPTDSRLSHLDSSSFPIEASLMSDVQSICICLHASKARKTVALKAISKDKHKQNSQEMK